MKEASRPSQGSSEEAQAYADERAKLDALLRAGEISVEEYLKKEREAAGVDDKPSSRVITIRPRITRQ